MSLRRRLLATLLLSVLCLPMVMADAPAWSDYEPGAFATALAEERAILIDVNADWCPTCKAQFPILDELRADERLQQVSFMRVDFDDNGEFLRKYRVPRQSTILLFRGGREVARSIAETDRDRLRAFVLDGFVE